MLNRMWLMKETQPDAKPDEAMLSKLAESQTVDIIQVLPATVDSGYVGVNLYVDDKGVAKGSPLNARASAICVALSRSRARTFAW